MRKTIARTILVAAVAFGAAACGFDTGATFNADGSVTVSLKFLFPKSLMDGANGATVTGMSPSDIAAANTKLQAKYPGPKITDRKSTRLNSSHTVISYDVCCQNKT